MSTALLLVAVAVVLSWPLRILWTDLRTRHGAKRATEAVTVLVVGTLLVIAAVCLASWVLWSAAAWLTDTTALVLILPALIAARLAYAAGRARQRAAHAVSVWQGHPR